jgi:hypothetical protein
MAMTTLTPPAAMASPLAEELPSSGPGTILALDLATKTGWALRLANGQIISDKRHIAGKGNADKQAVIAAVRERGFSPSDDNEADAIAILLWAIDTHGGVR